MSASSDPTARKRANKAVLAAAEFVERRGGAKENAELQSTVRTQSRVGESAECPYCFKSRGLSAPSGLRQVASRVRAPVCHPHSADRGSPSKALGHLEK